MFFKRHLSFLKTVFIYTLSAFGGPQGHFGMIMKMFVSKKMYFKESDLLETYAFCQMLPGASSTQLITLLAYKRGGYLTAILAFLIWIMPATALMATLSFMITDYAEFSGVTLFLKFIQPMAIGFLLFAFFKSYKSIIKTWSDLLLMLFATSLLYIFFKSPWIIPLIIVVSVLITYKQTNKRENGANTSIQSKIRWGILFVFLTLFLLVGFLSEISRKNDWSNRIAFNLIENNYRFGSMVFGGGDVLVPLMIDQYVARPKNQRLIKRNPGIIVLSKEQLLSGYGIVKAIPGPVFSITAYVAGISLQNDSFVYRITIILLATIAIFLPGILLMFLFYPIFKGVKQHPVVSNTLHNINTSLTGVMLASVVYLIVDMLKINFNQVYFNGAESILIIIITFILLNINKIHPSFVVLMCLVLSKILG